jgi:S-adenosylmethionine:tRNA-ribosyltransferase-isomerase (queuine synthetase)
LELEITYKRVKKLRKSDDELKSNDIINSNKYMRNYRPSNCGSSHSNTLSKNDSHEVNENININTNSVPSVNAVTTIKSKLEKSKKMKVVHEIMVTESNSNSSVPQHKKNKIGKNVSFKHLDHDLSINSSNPQNSEHKFQKNNNERETRNSLHEVVSQQLKELTKRRDEQMVNSYLSDE